jgi:hypothetical protein
MSAKHVCNEQNIPQQVELPIPHDSIGIVLVKAHQINPTEWTEM